MTVQDIVGLLGGLGGLAGLGALVAAFLGRRKLRAEAADVITDTALTLVEPLQKRVVQLEADADRDRKQLRVAVDGLADAIALIRRWRTAMRSDSYDRQALRLLADEQIDAEKASTT